MAANGLRIAITGEDIRWKNEADIITAILDNGWTKVHLRHPNATLADMHRLIEMIPQRLYPKLRLHGHFELLTEFNLGGVHLNSRCPDLPKFYTGSYSRSCHTLAETRLYADSCDYITLSPIFPSVSKPGYGGNAFSDSELYSLPSGKTVALGGVTPERINTLRKYPFAGYAVLGYLWEAQGISELNKRLKLFTEI